jgi:hypothetical protein
MLALLAHEAGDTFVAVAGELYLTVKADDDESVGVIGMITAPAAALDELEARGWLAVLPHEGTAITETGRYWLHKWLVGRLGKGRIRQAGQAGPADRMRGSNQRRATA